MRWIKMYNDFWDKEKWVSQATNEQVGAWVKLLSLASQGTEKGVVSIGMGLPFSPEQLEKLLGLTTLKYTELISFLKSKNAIITKNSLIYISNWKHYQSDYERQKPYRLHKKVTPKSDNVEVDVEVEVEVNKKRQELNKYGNAKDCVAYFYKLWNDKKGETYPNCNWGKHGKLLKNVLKTTSENKLKDLMAVYLSDYSDFNLKCGHSLETFVSALPGLMSKTKRSDNGLPSADEVLKAQERKI